MEDITAVLLIQLKGEIVITCEDMFDTILMYVYSQRFVEYFDSRACIDCHDYLNGQEYQGGTVDLAYLWDAPVK
jgi:hypothetical protein